MEELLANAKVAPLCFQYLEYLLLEIFVLDFVPSLESLLAEDRELLIQHGEADEQEDQGTSGPEDLLCREDQLVQQELEELPPKIWFLCSNLPHKPEGEISVEELLVSNDVVELHVIIQLR